MHVRAGKSEPDMHLLQNLLNPFLKSLLSGTSTNDSYGSYGEKKQIRTTYRFSVTEITSRGYRKPGQNKLV